MRTHTAVGAILGQGVCQRYLLRKQRVRMHIRVQTVAPVLQKCLIGGKPVRTPFGTGSGYRTALVHLAVMAAQRNLLRRVNNLYIAIQPAVGQLLVVIDRVTRQVHPVGMYHLRAVEQLRLLRLGVV